MPLYEYQCESCEQRFERIQRFSDPPIATCPACGGAVRKLPSSPAIQFKGTGWYITDYARKTGGSAKADAGDGKPASDNAGEKAGEKPAATSTGKDTTGGGETKSTTPTDKPA